MNTDIEMTEDELEKAFEFLPNHMTPSAWQLIGNGGVFDTHGKEREFVISQDPQTIWTVLDGERSSLNLVSGLHFINRLGYMISTTKVEENTTVYCHIK